MHDLSLTSLAICMIFDLNLLFYQFFWLNMILNCVLSVEFYLITSSDLYVTFVTMWCLGDGFNEWKLALVSSTPRPALPKSGVGSSHI